MKSKSRKLLSTLLAMVMAFSLFAAMQLTASAATTHTVSSAAELGATLAGAASGDTIKLMENVTYNSEININTAKTITFDLNGKTLNATRGLRAGSGARILLANPVNGEFNVSGKCDSGSYTVLAISSGTKVEVTNISTSVDGVDAAYATTGGQIIVFGNITHIGASGRGVHVLGVSEITVNGKITVSPGVTYARVGGSDKGKMGFEPTTSKPGYLEYKTTDGYFWLKQYPTVQVTLQPVGATYMLNAPATPLKATFEYDEMEPYGKVQDHATEAPIRVTWYWSATDSNTGRLNVLSEEPVVHTRHIIHTTTYTPKTDTVGVRYYYAVLTYKEVVTTNILVPGGSPSDPIQLVPQTTYVPREAVTDTARVEVPANAAITPNTVSFSKGNSEDITITVDLAGHTPVAIKNGAYTLQLGTDFTISGNVVSVKKSYLNTLDVGVHTITFNFSGGVDPTLTVTVTAASSVGMSKFVKTRTYSTSLFNDVDENQWYGFNQSKAIATAYEYNLVQGQGEGKFNPGGNIKVYELITLAVNVRRIYEGESGNLVMGVPWYMVFVEYAIAKGMIGATDFTALDFEREATRAEMAYIFSRCLPAAEYPSQNTVNSLPDVGPATPYREAIFTLYRAGIMSGNDALGTFLPANKMTRAEAAAIISFVILPETRKAGNTFG